MLRKSKANGLRYRILILGAAAFFYSNDGTQTLDAGLFDAHDLIRDKIGRRKLTCTFIDVKG